MKLICLLLLFFPATGLLAWEKYPGAEEVIISSDPSEAAKTAVEKGDFSLLLVADCFMGMPGYKGTTPPEENPRILGRTCEEIFGEERAENNKVLEEWAQQYNSYVQQHNNALKPTQ